MFIIASQLAVVRIKAGYCGLRKVSCLTGLETILKQGLANYSLVPVFVKPKSQEWF